VRRQDDDRALGHLGLVLDEECPLGLEILDDVQVVDDLLSYVHGGAVLEEGLLDRFDGAIYARAVSAGSGEEDLARHDSMVPATLATPEAMTRGHVLVGPPWYGGRRFTRTLPSDPPPQRCDFPAVQ
jgi:hypothetical protein